MARTKAEIVTALKAGVQAEVATLVDSATAKWVLLVNAFATALKVIEDLFDVHVEEVDERATEILPGTLKWYANESLKFQYDAAMTSTLVFDDSYTDADGETVELFGKAVIYDIEEPDYQIVTVASASELNGSVLLKVLKGSAGSYSKLTAGTEKAAFDSYWEQKRFAGTDMTIISNDPDLIQLEMDVTYDGTILASDGSLLTDGTTFPVHDAIDEFLGEFANARFDDYMYVSKLVDAVQAVSGVINAVATTVECKPNGGTYSDILAETEQKYRAEAGWIEVDPTYPLSSGITYILG